MNNKFFFSIMIYITISLLISFSNNDVPDEIEEIIATFDMPQLQRPIFPNNSINIIKTGAKENKLNTIAIQKAID